MSARDVLVTLVLGASPVVFVALLFVSAPYGRHRRAGWGPSLPARRGWMLMEAPAPLVFALAYALGPRALEPAPLALCALWQAHYAYRAFVYPLRVRSGELPAGVVAMAIAFNVVNGTLNGHSVAAWERYPADWLLDARFVAGAALFLGGLALNRWADAVLRALRRPGERGYTIPRGGAYEWVSCPNYLGEIGQWAGWALATWSLAGLSFAVFTAANLFPRALAHHRWYRERFPDYPKERRAILPFLV